MLEILIAITLLGLFVFGFLGSTVRCFYREKNSLLALKFQWEQDVHKIKFLSSRWKRAFAPCSENVDLAVTLGGKRYVKTYEYTLSCDRNRFLVVLTERPLGQRSNQKYYFQHPFIHDVQNMESPR